MNPSLGAASSIPVSGLDVSVRAAFIARTYAHLLGAIVLFTFVEIFLFRTGLAAILAEGMLGVNWLLVLGGFMVVGWLASRTAHRTESKPLQYLALVGF